MAKLTTVKSVAQLHRDLDVPRQTVTGWQQEHDLPTAANGEIILRDVINQFYKPHVIRLYKRTAEHKQAKDVADGTADKAKLLKLQQQEHANQLAQLKVLEKVNQLIPRENVKMIFTRSAERYRTAGELLAKHFGEDAQQILLDAIEAVEHDLEEMFPE